VTVSSFLDDVKKYARDMGVGVSGNRVKITDIIQFVLHKQPEFLRAESQILLSVSS
jgi:hypothetical protein